MANRRHMLDLMIGIVEEVAKRSPDMEQAVNIHHNFCQCERCTYTVGCQAPLFRSSQPLQLACQHPLLHCQMQCKHKKGSQVSVALCLCADSVALKVSLPAQ